MTAEGETVFNAALPLWKKAQAQLVDRLGKERWSGFLEDLLTAINLVQGDIFLSEGAKEQTR